MSLEQGIKNEDVELWRERKDDFQSDSIHVTKEGWIGINCGGSVIVQSVRAWFSLASDKIERGLVSRITSKLIRGLAPHQIKSRIDRLRLQPGDVLVCYNPEMLNQILTSKLEVAFPVSILCAPEGIDRVQLGELRQIVTMMEAVAANEEINKLTKAAKPE